MHINAEFGNQTSDHDPQVVRFPLFPLFANIRLIGVSIDRPRYPGDARAHREDLRP